MEQMTDNYSRIEAESSAVRYTQRQLNAAVRSAVTASKIQDAVSVSRYAGSTVDAAEQILKCANITRAEIRNVIDDKHDRKRLYALLG